MGYEEPFCTGTNVVDAKLIIRQGGPQPNNPNLATYFDIITGTTPRRIESPQSLLK